MKSSILFWSTVLLPASITPLQTIAQNVGIGTATPVGKIHIAGDNDVSQLVIDAGPAQSNINPLIKLRNGLGELIWIHSDHELNTFIGLEAGRSNNVDTNSVIGQYNTFIGSRSGYFNSGGYSNTSTGAYTFVLNTVGRRNSAYGAESLYSNTVGDDNSAFGANALTENSIGDFNCAFGVSSMGMNTSGSSNSAFGHSSLWQNIGGSQNTAFGSSALAANTNGFGNTAAGSLALHDNNGDYNTSNGYWSLESNTIGDHNVGVGSFSNHKNTTGSYNTTVGSECFGNTISSQYNTAVGYGAGYVYNNGWNNVFVGANTDVQDHAWYNVVAVGQATVCTNVSQARIGNSATSSIGGYADWTNISDGRFKKNIKENVPGIEFIVKLRPVTYTLDATGIDAFLHTRDVAYDPEANPWHQRALREKEAITWTGFIAQDVEVAAKELGFDFSGVDAAKNAHDTYGLRYGTFVVPLVKAVQELAALAEEQRQKIETLTSENGRIQSLESEIASLRREIQALKSGK